MEEDVRNFFEQRQPINMSSNIFQHTIHNDSRRPASASSYHHESAEMNRQKKEEDDSTTAAAVHRREMPRCRAQLSLILRQLPIGLTMSPDRFSSQVTENELRIKFPLVFSWCRN